MLAAGWLVLGGCVATREGELEPGHAECLVCRCAGDLACIDVEIESDTPRAVVEGQTFYFCSDECRCEFQEDPAEYVTR